MGRLIILAGGSGAGKSFMLSKINEINERVARQTNSNEKYIVVKKYSTRKRRQNETDENSDILFGTNEDWINRPQNEQFLKYPYGNHIYGIDCTEIDKILADGNNPIVIVRDISTIEKLKNKYSCVIDLYCTAAYSGESLKDILRKNGCTNDEVSERLENSEQDRNQWYFSSNVFYDVIRNWYDEEFLNQIVAILSNAPNINQKQICIVGYEHEVKNISNYACAKFEKQDYIIKHVYIDKIDLDDETAIKDIKQARLVIMDLTIGDADCSNKFEWLVDVKEIKNLRDILLLQSDESAMPFDIFDHKVYRYNKKAGELHGVVVTQVEKILKMR